LTFIAQDITDASTLTIYGQAEANAKANAKAKKRTVEEARGDIVPAAGALSKAKISPIRRTLKRSALFD
jgi:hypothetical protein